MSASCDDGRDGESGETESKIMVGETKVLEMVNSGGGRGGKEELD